MLAVRDEVDVVDEALNDARVMGGVLPPTIPVEAASGGAPATCNHGKVKGVRVLLTTALSPLLLASLLLLRPCRAGRACNASHPCSSCCVEALLNIVGCMAVASSDGGGSGGGCVVGSAAPNNDQDELDEAGQDVEDDAGCVPGGAGGGSDCGE